MPHAYKYSNLSVYLEQRERERKIVAYAWALLSVVLVAVAYYTMQLIAYF